LLANLHWRETVMSAIDKEPFPRGALIAAGALVAFALLAAGLGRLQPEPPRADTAPLAAIAVTFTDEADGGVSVRTDDTGALVTTLPPRADGFVRSVLRSMVRDRRSRGIDATPPFLLARWPNGALTLEDTATGRRVDLRAFGPTNRDAFARILDAGTAT
jgi:putative photosynthetic complex assembly protein